MKLHSHTTASASAPPLLGRRLGCTVTAVLSRLPRLAFHVSHFTLLSALLVGAPAAQAVNTLYNIQLVPTWGSAYQSGAALIGSPGDYWNKISSVGTYSGLATAANVSSSVNFNCTGSGFAGGTANPSFGSGCANLMSGYMYNTGSGSMSFANLPVNSPFTLYIYTQGDSTAGGRRTSVTYGSTYVTSPTVANATSFVNGQNYLVISGTTTAGGALSLTYGAYVNEADINGLQLMVTTTAPSVASQPASQTVAVGGSATFNVVASGTAPLSYQWRLNGSTIGGATSASFTINSVALGHAGSYTVIITNLYGSVTSSVATLTLAILPVITNNPASQAVLPGGSATFSITAGGLPSPGYQWRFNGAAISGATGTSYSLTGITAGNVGFYSVLLTNMVGSITSTPVALTVLSTNGSVAVLGAEPDTDWNADVQAKLIASGLFSSVDVYQVDTATPSLATLQQYSAVLVYSDDMFADATTLGNNLASYVDAGGTVVMGLFSLESMAGMTPGGRFAAGGYLPVTVPYNYTNNIGGTYGLVADLPGSPLLAGVSTFTNLLCQIPLALASGATRVARLDNGQPMVVSKGRVVALNLFPPSSDVYDSWLAGTSGGRLMANALSYSPPYITTNPASQVVFCGSNATFSVTATGASPLSYQWRFNGVAISGATAASYALTGVTSNNAGSYTVILTNIFGSVTSSVAVLTTLPPAPSVAANPAGSVVGLGAATSLSVTA
ncbi:MAG: immunoglobulin domain-containing protein, partial [Verrucomicrobiota bacterium]